MRDDGYDISDYTDVHPEYGTLRDFKAFLREAHARGLRVITELVLNHTSDQHPWFQRARRAPPGSPLARFLRLERHAREATRTRGSSSRTSRLPTGPGIRWPRRTTGTASIRISRISITTIRAVARGMFDAIDFWFELGVDGLRLDAVPYLFEREGTNCENLPETHAFLRELRRHVDAKFPNRMLLAEANQWPEDAVAYFGRAATNATWRSISR